MYGYIRILSCLRHILSFHTCVLLEPFIPFYPTVYIHVYTCTCIYTYIHVRVRGPNHVHQNFYMHVHMHICIYACMYSDLYVYSVFPVCILVCMYACIRHSLCTAHTSCIYVCIKPKSADIDFVYMYMYVCVCMYDANPNIIDVRYQFSTVFTTSLLLENRWNHDNGRQLFCDWQ